ncbi:MAG: thiol peroxidase [Planctomycetota bacterium]|jgi:thiol peroxidase|nr:thiol peroxidase [Planctomycetota bacterium]
MFTRKDEPQEHDNVITFRGNPMTLVGDIRRAGDAAPNFPAVKNDLTEMHLHDILGMKALILSVPSLDTPVCDLEVRRFNREAAKLKNVKVLTISMDLPFAQARWCGAAGIENIVTLSDYKYRGFGLSYGLLIKELMLLTRAVIVVDEKGVITHQEIVREVSEHPNYDAAIIAAG